LTKPWLAFSLIAWLLRHCFTHPVHLTKSLLLVPRAVDIFAKIEKEQPDVVHLFWGHYPALVAFLVENYLPDIVLTIFLGAYDLSREFPGTPDVARRADAVWTHAQANIEKIVSLGVPAQKIQVTYRGIDLRLIGAADCPRVAHRLVSAGRMLPLKGMETVLSAFRIIRNQWSDATLILLGEGPERPRLEKLVGEWGLQDAVVFRGHVPHSEVFAEMAVAEVFLLLSRSSSERLPNAAKEAMASGCACIVTDTDGIDELITHEKSGYIVSQKVLPEEVAEIVTRFFVNAELRASFQRYALERLRERFDVDASMRTYLENWSGLLRERCKTLP
jgi:glycosyltransferase involved in cell wall biosynthesis